MKLEQDVRSRSWRPPLWLCLYLGNITTLNSLGFGLRAPVLIEQQDRSTEEAVCGCHCGLHLECPQEGTEADVERADQQ
jgi:hypothetical protein